MKWLACLALLLVTAPALCANGMPPAGMMILNGKLVPIAEYSWKPVTAGIAYAVKPLQDNPSILLVAARGATLSEPVVIAFYIQSSSFCKSMTNPIDGPAEGSFSAIQLVEIDGKNYTLDGWCDGGNLVLTPTYWVNRKALLTAVENDTTLVVRLKPGPVVAYDVSGFQKVLSNITAAAH